MDESANEVWNETYQIRFTSADSVFTRGSLLRELIQSVSKRSFSMNWATYVPRINLELEGCVKQSRVEAVERFYQISGVARDDGVRGLTA